MMKKLNLLVMAATFACTVGAQSLQSAYRDYWRMGVSVNQWEVKSEQAVGTNLNYSGGVSADQTSHYQAIAQHFGWVVPENCMKCEVIHPKEGVYDFTLGDQLVEKALANGQQVIGHCLIWHSQCAPWFFVDAEGKQVSAEVLKQRMRDHIFTILGHYRGKVASTTTAPCAAASSTKFWARTSSRWLSSMPTKPTPPSNSTTTTIP